jgi:glycosidase
LDITAALRNGENLVVVQVMDYSGGGGIYRPMTLIETRYLDDLLKSEFFGTPALKSPEWVKDAVIYEVYLRSFSTEGTFAGLEKRIPELKKLGVTVVWLMPIHPVGAKNRKGRLGSPYAVQDYYGINPEFGTLREFKRLVTTVHKNGMKLIIDLVANHTSWDSKLMAEHPEWFTKDARGTIVPPNADWTDVADLDYAHPALRSYMIAMMRYWVKDVGIDGYRCDVAELVPTEFWNDARHQLNTIKPVMMLSEGSIPEHHAKAFDITYSWNIYDALGVLLMGKRPATLLDDILKNESLQFPTGSLRMRFTTNHDKNACDAPAIEKYGLPGLKLGVVLTFTMPGVPLIYNGEEVGNNRKLDLFEKVDIDWRRSREMGDLFASLARLRRDHKALTRGEMFRLASGHDEDVYAFVRMAGRDKVVVILNFANEPRFTTVAVPMGMVFPGRSQVTLKEHFGGIPLELNTENEQMELSLAPREFRIFVVEKE